MVYVYGESSARWEQHGSAPIIGGIVAYAPFASMTFTAQDLVCSFDASASTQKNGTITGYAWTFGDGGTSSVQKPTHTYAAPGTYTVALTVTGSLGRSTSTQYVLTVTQTAAPKPTAAFSLTQGTGTDYLRVDGDASASTVASGRIVRWDWDFTQSKFSSTTSPLAPGYRYNAAGSYRVALTVTTDLGATATTAKTLTIVAPNVAPTAALALALAADGVTATATASYADSDGYVASLDLDWGDGTAHSVATRASATGTFPATATHVYGAAGAYTVTLLATDDDGASVKVSKAITVAPVSSGGGGSGGGTGTQPSGTEYVAVQNLSGSTLGAKVRAAGGKRVALQPSTTYLATAFNDNGTSYGVSATSGFSGIVGAGPDSSIIKAAAALSSGLSDSTGASPTVPRLLLVSGSNLIFQDFQFRGTPQKHIYHGLSVTGANPTFTRVKGVATPGNDLSPHGETFMLEAYACTGTVRLRNVELDGAGVAASGFGINGNASNQATYDVDGLYVHGVGTTKASAFWQSYQGGTFKNVQLRGNGIGWGFEECAGTWTLQNVEFGDTIFPADIHLGSSHTSLKAQLRIIDPIFRNGQTKVRVWVPATYGGNLGGQGNSQTIADVKVYRTVNGALQDVTSTSVQSVPYPFPTNPSLVAGIFAERSGTTVAYDGGVSYHVSSIASSALSYAWVFGDGSTATGQTVKKTFASSNATTAKLTVSYGGYSKSKTITV